MKRNLNLLVLLAAAGTACVTAAPHNILDYGAIAGTAENTTVAFANSEAMTRAIVAANSSEPGDRTVLIPKGSAFVMMPVAVAYLRDVTFQIDGEVYASQDYQSWNKSDPKHYLDFWSIDYSDSVSFTGSGLVDG